MDEQNQIDRMLLDYIDENRDQLVEHVRQMVRIDSVEREARDGAPFGPGVKKAPYPFSYLSFLLSSLAVCPDQGVSDPEACIVICIIPYK